MKPSQLNSTHPNSNGTNQFKHQSDDCNFIMSTSNSIKQDIMNKGIADILFVIACSIFTTVTILTIVSIVLP